MTLPLPPSLPTDENRASARLPIGREWIGRFLARNPFYLVSAALLLFGINRLSIDPSFLGTEEPKLAFNFAALQLYELLLVFVAIVLGVRRVWYDSTLLVVLENGLLLVPFILVTQAILIGKGLATVLCVTGTLMALARFDSLHRWIPQLRLSSRLLGYGGLVLILNLALPIFFRPIIEADVANWEAPGRIGWFFVLPALGALVNLLPRPTHYDDLAPRKSWLPLLMAGMWITGSAVHLGCVGYVAGRVFEPVYLLPILWVAAWTACNRITDLQESPSRQLRSILLYFPMTLPFLALGEWQGQVAFVLMAVNTVLYACLAVRQGGKTPAFQLACISLVGLAAALPLDWGRWVLPDFNRPKAICMATGTYVILQAILSRHPAIGLCGALIAGVTPAFLLGKPLWNEGLQMACTFLLLHSYRWTDRDSRQKSILRFVTAVTLGVHALAWTHSDETFSRVTVSSSAVAILAGYFLFRWLRGYYPPVVLLAAASICLLAVPIQLAIRVFRASPVGLLSIMGSFVLFGAGTILAMNKHRWQQALAKTPSHRH
jgi:hypothetical protein